MHPGRRDQQEEVDGAVGAAIDQLGYVDIVVNNAGGSNFMVDVPRPAAVRLGQAHPAQPDSAVYVCHAFADHLLERGQGSVINVASVAGVARRADDRPLRRGQGRG